MESLSIALIYHFDLPTLNDLTRIFLHDEIKKELRGKKTKNEVFLSSTSSTKLNCISLIRTCVRDLPLNTKETITSIKIQTIGCKVVWSC